VDNCRYFLLHVDLALVAPDLALFSCSRQPGARCRLSAGAPAVNLHWTSTGDHPANISIVSIEPAEAEGGSNTSSPAKRARRESGLTHHCRRHPPPAYAYFRREYYRRDLPNLSLGKSTRLTPALWPVGPCVTQRVTSGETESA
jgi:hypothetical protein